MLTRAGSTTLKVLYKDKKLQMHESRLRINLFLYLTGRLYTDKVCLPAGGFAQLPLLPDSSAFKAAALTGKLVPQTGDRQRRAGERREENIELDLTLPSFLLS